MKGRLKSGSDRATKALQEWHFAFLTPNCQERGTHLCCLRRTDDAARGRPNHTPKLRARKYRTMTSLKVKLEAYNRALAGESQLRATAATMDALVTVAR